MVKLTPLVEFLGLQVNESTFVKANQCTLLTTGGATCEHLWLFQSKEVLSSKPMAGWSFSALNLHILRLGHSFPCDHVLGHFKHVCCFVLCLTYF